MQPITVVIKRTIITIILGGIGFLFLGTVLTRTLEQIETPILVVFGVLTVVLAIIIQVSKQKKSKQQIYDVTGTIDGKNL
jgi:hypothetical protein